MNQKKIKHVFGQEFGLGTGVEKNADVDSAITDFRYKVLFAVNRPLSCRMTSRMGHQKYLGRKHQFMEFSF